MKTVYIALGANLSNPKITFTNALKTIEYQAEIVKVSGLWKSPSWPLGYGYPDYLNAVAKVRTRLTPLSLLEFLKSIEFQFGRKYTKPNAPRILDLDILDFNDQIFQSESLILPHPRMLERGFVLFPLEEIEPNWANPINGMSIQHYLSMLSLKDVDAMTYQGKLLP